MQKGTTTAYWFQPEEESPSKIIDRYVGKKVLYRALSMVVHSTHFGMTWFKDEPDDIDFNRSENPKFTNNALLMSNPLLLDSLWLRSRAEGLNLRPLYEGLLSKSKRAARSLLKGPVEYVN